jgi:hypothetical protein
MNKTEWYDNKLYLFLSILFLPVFFYIVWKNSYMVKKTRIILTFLGCLLLAWGGYLDYKSKDSSFKAFKSAEASQKLEIPKTSTNKTVCQKGETFYDVNGNTIVPDVTYEIVKEELSDTPQKTQIVQYVGLEGSFDREIVLKVLELCYFKAKKRTGFQNYNPANSYSIVVYADSERAKAQMRWLGQISQYKNMATYNVEVNEELILATKLPEIEKFGYSVKERKQIFNALANPSQLSNEMIDSIYKKHNLTKVLADSILWEGGIKSWVYTSWYKSR